jgi:hypothetical protein
VDDPAPEPAPPGEAAQRADAPELPEGVLRVRVGPGANCSSAGSAIDLLFYGSVILGAIAVAIAAAMPPEAEAKEAQEEPREGDG